MPVTPQVLILGLRDLQRDLRAMAPQAELETRLVVRRALEPMRKVAIANSPGTGRTIGSRWRTQARGSSGALTNTHPGVRPHEFGGHITPNPDRQPRGITFTAAHMIYGDGGALEQTSGDVERDLLFGFQRLAREHGWH